jgi:hypothetical protein
MPEQHLFEYAVVRVMPQVEREEFMNTGVVLYCAKQHFLKAIIKLDEVRLKAFSPQCDAAALNAHLQAFQRICVGGRGSGPIGELSPAERFRWLTATRSTVVQTSKVHPGFCVNTDDMLRQLFNVLVSLHPVAEKPC